MFSRLHLDGYKTADIETEIEVMTQPTDQQLKQALAKMLPETIIYHAAFNKGIAWASVELRDVLDTELLHLCWLVEKEIDDQRYSTALMNVIRDDLSWTKGAVEARYATAKASWQQRVIALAKVKGIEIL